MQLNRMGGKIHNNSDIVGWRADALLSLIRYLNKCHLEKKTMCSLKLKNQRVYLENKKTGKNWNAGTA